jgi:hypothetical protein
VGIGKVCIFSFRSKEIIFLQGLGGILRIDAGRSEESSFLTPYFQAEPMILFWMRRLIIK